MNIETRTEVFEAPSTVEKWDNDYYTPISEKLYDNAVAAMLSAINPPAGCEILDAGCGPGVHSIRAARAGFHVHAVDISSTMLDQARIRVREAGQARMVRFSQMDLTRLPLPDASVEAAFSWGVVIHIPDAEKALGELVRVLKPGGRLGLYITNSTALDHKFERIARVLFRKPIIEENLSLGPRVRYGMQSGEIVVWRFDAAKLTRFMAGLGCRLILRRSGELSEVQIRARGLIRSALQHVNNVAYAMNAPASLAVTQLMVFEKR
jgi:ubiquinone/menaquinone biosynthesis C-methylase UbiE